MMFKKGNKVAFINEPLKGVVIESINDSYVRINCDGIEMDVHHTELIVIQHIPKIDGKHKFPIQKADKRIDDMPDISSITTNNSPLSLGDEVMFMSDNSRGIIRSIISNDQYEVEIDKDFCIPVHRIEIEKIKMNKININDKQLKQKLQNIVHKKSVKNSKPHKESESDSLYYELDLHIEKLTNSWKDLSNFEIVSIQLDYFQKRLFEALKDNEPSFVVIHGIGRGVLKDEIQKLLLQFPNISMKPASSKNYGMGASEIIIS